MHILAQNGSSSQSDVNVTTYTTDLLTFSTGDNINLNVSQSDFKKDMGNKSASTYAKAMLTANNKTNEATVYYNIYLDIVTNNFVHSQSDETGELILKITDPQGNELKSIDGLNYKEVTDGKGNKISGFDITTQTELVTIASNYAITATPKKEDTWNVTLTFVNLDKDQSKNAGKSFSALLKIQKNEDGNKALLADYIKSLYTGTQGENSIYYHDTGLANGAGDNSYRYAGASESVNNFVCFGSSESPCPTDNLYRIIGVFEDKVKLIKYDYANNNLLGTDGDYQGTGTPNATYYKGSLTTVNSYYWNYENDTSINNGNGSNEWSTSLFNKINLNTNYLNNIGATWSNMIEDTTWKVSGHTTNEVTAKNMYTAEITNATKTYGPSDGTSKIGLMYASDYGFAADPSAWTKTLYNYDSSTVRTVNWMYMGFYDWTISPSSSDSLYVFSLNRDGDLYSYTAGNGNGARPVLYLKASVAYAGGSGTKDSPITLGV